MGFDQQERSNYGGIPTKLYEFRMENVVWRYASGDQDVTLLGSVYEALSISDSGVKQSGDTEGEDFTVQMPSDADFTRIFRGTPPSQQILVTVRTMNRGESETPIIWAGIVKNCKMVDLASCEVTAKPLTSSLDRLGVRLSWGRGCPHALYDRNCRVNKADFAVTAQVSSLTGDGLSAPLGSFADTHFSGGFIEFQRDEGYTDRRAIEVHAGNNIVLLGTSDGLSVGMYVTLYPGCDLISSTCELKFNNLSNYGGFIHLPTKSPFDGDPVF